MQKFHKHLFEASESLLNAESSSLPSVLTDPGPATTGDQGDNFTDEGDELKNDLQKYGDNCGSCELMVDYDDIAAGLHDQTPAMPGTSQSMVDGSIVNFTQRRSRNKRARMQTSGRPRAASAKRADRKKRQRTHSEADLRKIFCRPIIASPFMPTLAAQISVDARMPSTSQDGEFRRRFMINNTNNNNITPLNHGGTGPSAPNEIDGSISLVSVPVTNAANFSSTSGIIKVISHSKYGSLPLKKAPSDVKVRNASVIVPATIVNEEKINNEDEENLSDEDEDEESSSSESSSELSTYATFSSLSKKQWATVGMLAVSNLCSTVAFSCIAPFYPGEAQEKGMNASEIGVVFGVFELVMFFFAPVLGKYMAFFGSKRMFLTGLLVTGVTAILFGFLNYLPANRTFFWASLTVRCLEALGDACFVTSSFAISAKCFPGRIATIVGLMETFAGLGYTAGPVIGSVLYEYGGFQLPFLVLGIILIFAAILSYYLIEEIKDEPSEAAMGMLSMLKIPVIWLMVFAVIICAISLSFFDPTLADHLSSFNLSTIMIGLMFLLCGGIYTITAPLWGLLLDRWHCCNWLMLFGSSATVVSMALIGPTPIFNIEKNLVIIGIALAVLGVAAGALYIPTFQNCLDAVKENGFDDSFQTYGCVSGVFQSAFAFGAFMGPTLGGFGVQQLGFGWTTTIIGGINLCFIFALLAFLISKNCLKKYRSLGTNVNQKKRYTLA